MSVIVCDCDNVLCNLQEVVVNLFNERYGTNYTLNDFTEYDIMNILSTEDAMKMKDIYGESGLYNLVRPLPGAQDGLQKLIHDGHMVYIVTDAIPGTYGEKVDFIHRYFPFINDEYIVSMKHKHMLRCDIMIEDNLANLIAKPYYERICLNYPWNQCNDWVYNIHRCYNWEDVVSVVHKINDGG